MVVAALGPPQNGAGLDHRRPAEFSPPDHEGAVQQAAALEISHERRAPAVGGGAQALEIAGDVRVGIPALVVDRDEPHAPLHQQAVPPLTPAPVLITTNAGRSRLSLPMP